MLLQVEHEFQARNEQEQAEEATGAARETHQQHSLRTRRERAREKASQKRNENKGIKRKDRRQVCIIIGEGITNFIATTASAIYVAAGGNMVAFTRNRMRTSKVERTERR